MANDNNFFLLSSAFCFFTLGICLFRYFCVLCALCGAFFLWFGCDKTSFGNEVFNAKIFIAITNPYDDDHDQ